MTEFKFVKSDFRISASMAKLRDKSKLSPLPKQLHGISINSSQELKIPKKLRPKTNPNTTRNHAQLSKKTTIEVMSIQDEETPS